MIMKMHRPSGLAGEVVGLMVYHRDYTPAHYVERFLPDGGVELVVDLDSAPKHIFDNETLHVTQTCRGTWLSGIRTAPISISTGSGGPMLVVSLVPAEARRVVGHPMRLFADSVVDAEDVIGPTVRVLRERLLAAPGPSDCFRIASDWIARRVASTAATPIGMRRSTEMIAQTPTLQTIDRYARDANVSGKHLWHQFREYIGISPKRFQRIHRFQSVIVAAETVRELDWTRIALEHGYYDQSHLISDFRSFSGFSPTEYIERRGQVLNYVPV